MNMTSSASAAGLLTRGLRAVKATASMLARDIVESRPANPLDERDPDFIRDTLPAYRLLTQTVGRLVGDRHLRHHFERLGRSHEAIRGAVGAVPAPARARSRRRATDRIGAVDRPRGR